MSTPRITQRLMVERSLGAMQAGMSRLARSQEQLSTGRQINRPSDSPAGTNTAMRLREQLAADTQHARNASDGLAWLGRTDNTLTTMLDGTRRARDLILQGASAGSSSPQVRQILAIEVEQIQEALLALANTQHLGRPLFGGTTDRPAAYSKDPVTGVVGFVGEPGSQVVRRVGDGLAVPVNTLGPDAFEAGGTSLFTVLGDAVAALRDPAADPAVALDALDAVSRKMMTALADVGTRYGRVESAMRAVTNSTLDMQAALSEVENVDIAKAIVDLQMQEVAYQSALGATARVIQPSLLDFLR